MQCRIYHVNVFMIVFICSGILITASAFHFYWGFGGRYGQSVSIPQYPTGGRVFNPRSSAAHIVGAALLGSVLCILSVTDYLTLPIPNSLPRAAIALLSFIFVIRAVGWFRYIGFFKKVRNTPFARYDTWLYCPLCLFLGISIGYILLNA
jgi:hypothetical protein